MKIVRIILVCLLIVFTAPPAFCDNGDSSGNSTVDVGRKFILVLEGQFGNNHGKLSKNTSLRGDLGADNTDMLELCMAVEEYFDIEIPDEDWAGVTTIESAVEVIVDIKNSRRW